MFLKTSDDFQIRAEVQSWTSDESVLFIHGNLACSEWWFPAIEQLQALAGKNTFGRSSSAQPDRNRTPPSGALIAADWRGYGQSKGLETPNQIQFERYARDYLELLDHLKVNKAHIVGHSTGGLIAMMAVLQNPERFQSLVLLDSVGLKGLELSLPLDQVLEHFDQLSKNKEFCGQVLASTIEGMSPDSPFFQSLLEITWQCDPVCWRGVPEVLASQIDLADRSKELRLPTLILHGEKDLVLPPSGSEELHLQIRGSLLEIVEGHGHSLNLEDPKSFAEKLILFWKEGHSGTL